jgi:hypothetical protein
LLDWLRVEYDIEKSSNQFLAATELDSDTREWWIDGFVD